MTLEGGGGAVFRSTRWAVLGGETSRGRCLTMNRGADKGVRWRWF